MTMIAHADTATANNAIDTAAIHCRYHLRLINKKDLVVREMQHWMPHKRPAPLGDLQGTQYVDEGQGVERNEY